jgi:hypothetical protein
MSWASSTKAEVVVFIKYVQSHIRGVMGMNLKLGISPRQRPRHFLLVQ